MKRLALALTPCLIGMLLVPSLAHAQLPALTGHNVVVGIGPRAVLVRLREPVEIDYHKPFQQTWFESFRTSGSYAAVMIAEESPNHHGQELFFMRLSRPAGCSKSNRCRPVTHEGVRVQGEPNTTGLPESMILERGTYWIYVLTDPGERVEARFNLPGLEGKTRLNASQPVSADLQSDVYPSTIATYARGKMTGSLSGEGVVRAGIWESPFPTEPTFRTGGTSRGCFMRGRGGSDDLDTCGYPLDDRAEYSSVNGRSLNHHVDGGTWTFAHQYLGATDLDGRVGAYALFLTFL